MTRKKCQLCSRLSSGLKEFFHRFFGIGIDCQGLNRRTLDSDQQRVGEINAAAPDCVCEKGRMSRHSPGVINNSEILARFVFFPIQIDKKGRFKPSLFSHVHSKGCSIQRDSVAKNDELLEFVREFLSKKDDRSWKGVLFGKCHDIRSISANEAHRRAVCVYDTANADNPAHAELCQTQYVIDEADEVELRANLFVAFGDNGALVSPRQYRNGAVWHNLPQNLQTRT